MSTIQHPASSHHSLAFRVMRLCRPTFQAEDAVLRLDPFDLFAGEDLFDDPAVSPSLLDRSYSKEPSRVAAPVSAGGEFSYRTRFLLQTPTDSVAISGNLMLPQSFGSIYLGEKFSSYISVNNSSSFEARDVVIKAEIQTERQRTLLLDTSKSPVESIRSGGRYDFIVEHDVKELGQHTLVCSALYNDGDSERKYLPQFFKFLVANPLSVRTKVRTVKDKTYLEACIENHTKSNLYMDQVDFEPAPNWSATVVKVDEHPLDANLNIRLFEKDIFRSPVLIQAGGGIQNYLYQLKHALQSGQFKIEGSNILGKLQITWRMNLGEPGRLQTQNILGTPITSKEVEIQIVEVPSFIVLERPFSIQFKIRNTNDRMMGPLEVSMLIGEDPDERTVLINGLQKLALTHVDPYCSVDLSLSLIAIKLGVQKISPILVSHAHEDKVYDTSPEMEIFVERS